MITPTNPSNQEIRDFVFYKCMNILSDSDYDAWVNQRVKEKCSQHTRIYNNVKLVEGFVCYWKNYIELMGKREIGGISVLCKNIQFIPAITTENLCFNLDECCITRLKKRPCFDIMSSRSGEVIIKCHHSLVQTCQCIWSLYHVNTLLNAYVQIFRESIQGGSLLDIAVKFQASERYSEVCTFLEYAFRRVDETFVRDNNFRTVFKQVSTAMA